ncbi:hypothetical protein EMCRGX_G020727 [Ephydatia muelleri]
MVDNGAKVFVLAEKILSAQQGNALLGKSWKKATLQGKVLSKVANKRARLVKFHLLKQPIPVSTRILSLDENLVTVKGKRKLESRMNVTPESAPSEFSDDDANLEDMDENENSSNKVDLNNDEEVSKSKDGESMDESEVETESEEDDTTMNENDINDDDDDGDGGGDDDGSVDDDHGESGDDDDHDDGGIDDSSDEDGDNDRDDGGDDCDDGAVDGIVAGGVNRKQQQKITRGKRKMQQKIAHVTVGDLQWKHYLHPMDVRVANGWKEKPKITWDDNLSDLHHGALNYFLLFFLKPQIISEIIEFTNQRLERTRQKKLAGKYEFFKFVGLLLRKTLYPNLSRQECWQNGSVRAFTYPDFGKDMRIDRFNRIFSAMAFLPIDEDPEYNSSVSYTRSVVVKGKQKSIQSFASVQLLVDGFNDARLAAIRPGSGLCVDECMSKWRGKDDRFGDGAAHITKIVRKPESVGVEIKAICCCETNVMMRIEPVDSKYAPRKKFAIGNNAGTAVTQRLTEPWKGTGRTVYGDSAFASVNTCVRMHQENGLHFMGLVKTAHSQFPKKYIEEYPFEHRGDSIFLRAESNGTEIFATGEPHEKKCWNNEESSSHIYFKKIPRDATTAEYFSMVDRVDYHNRFRQGYLATERSIDTTRWTMRFFCTILGMCVTDAYFAQLYFGSKDNPLYKERFGDFVLEVIGLLLDNTFDGRISRTMEGLPGIVYSQAAVHEIKGLTDLNRQMEFWKDTNPKKACSDCSVNGRKKANLAAKYCVTCTQQKQETEEVAVSTEVQNQLYVEIDYTSDKERLQQLMKSTEKGDIQAEEMGVLEQEEDKNDMVEEEKEDELEQDEQEQWKREQEGQGEQEEEEGESMRARMRSGSKREQKEEWEQEEKWEQEGEVGKDENEGEEEEGEQNKKGASSLHFFDCIVQEEQKADANIVLSCLEASLHALKQKFFHVTKLIVQSNNAKNLAGKQTKLLLPYVCSAAGLKLITYYHNKAQSGKDVCDTHFSHQQTQVDAYLVQGDGGRKVSIPKLLH